MILINKQARVVVLQGLTELIQLVPGANEISDAEFEFILPSIEAAGMIKSGKIELGPQKKEKVGEGEEQKTVRVGKTLRDLSPEDAEEIINETYDLKLLETWKKGEKREDVRMAILNRIDVVKAGPKPDENADKAE